MMENYIEKLLCLEVLEKVSRLKRYLLSHHSSSKMEGKEVVGIFMKALDGVQKNLEKIISILRIAHKLNFSEKASVLRQISKVFIVFEDLHNHLQLVYGSWVRPETHTFINEVLTFFPGGRRPSKVNVVLRNEYSFVESNLSGLFEYILCSNDMNINLKEETPTVYVPKIDYDNPLNWSILVHECGHVDITGITELLSNPEIIPENIDEEKKLILKNWVEEIYCDLFATLVLGPAYLVSFATYALLVSGIEGNEETADSHPANIVRISIIYEVLESLNLRVPLSEEIMGCKDIGTFYYSILEQYNELSRKNLNLRPSEEYNPKKLPFDLTVFVDIITEQVEKLINVDILLSENDFSRIKHLKNRLENGITIGGYQQLDKLKQVKANYSIVDNNIEKLNEAKEALQETRTNLWEIINAGWLNKIESIYPKAFDLFFANTEVTSLTKKIEIFNKMLENNDRVLLKSIESSQIFKIMERQNGTIRPRNSKRTS